MSAPDSAQFTNSSVSPNQSVNVSVNLKAPASAGTYKGFFRLRAPDGTLFGVGDKGGVAFFVEIKAVEQKVIPPLNRLLRLRNPFMTGNDVKMLQERLLQLGYNVVETADGIFGPKTDQGVRQFQTDKGLAVDGIVGENTWAKLWE